MSDEGVFSDFLEEGESLLWIGRPAATFAFSPSERGVLLLTAAMLAAFAWFAWRVVVGEAPGVGDPGFIWAAVMAAAPLAFVWFSARLLLRSLSRRRRMVYCLTDRRALIVEATKRKAWAWLRIDYDTPVAVTEAAGRRGHISFGRRYDFDAEEWPLFRGFTFFNIKDPAKVIGLIDALQKKLAPPGAETGKARASRALLGLPEEASPEAGMKLTSL